MLSAGEWKKNQPNTILFVMIDTVGAELDGLGSTFILEVSKAGAAFAASAGTKAEISDGWYTYTSTAGEADTSGPIGIKVTAAGAIQQNLEYIVDDRVITAIAFTYTVTSTAGNVPLENVKVNIYTDALATNIVWSGLTDAFGIARDAYGALPRLEPGTYFLYRELSGYLFLNPDVETVVA